MKLRKREFLAVVCVVALTACGDLTGHDDAYLLSVTGTASISLKEFYLEKGEYPNDLEKALVVAGLKLFEKENDRKSGVAYKSPTGKKDDIVPILYISYYGLMAEIDSDFGIHLFEKSKKDEADWKRYEDGEYDVFSERFELVKD